jgi:uncharacterized protein YfiM (DUF2279 family)
MESWQGVDTHDQFLSWMIGAVSVRNAANTKQTQGNRTTKLGISSKVNRDLPAIIALLGEGSGQRH